MNITEVRVRKVESEGKTRAFASITFDNSFVVHDLRIIEGDRGLFVAMPSRRMPDGERKDIAHPLNNQMRDQIQERVLQEYERS
jgi:stage V sporulation protein G